MSNMANIINLLVISLSVTSISASRENNVFLNQETYENNVDILLSIINKLDHLDMISGNKINLFKDKLYDMITDYEKLSNDDQELLELLNEHVHSEQDKDNTNKEKGVISRRRTQESQPSKETTTTTTTTTTTIPPPTITLCLDLDSITLNDMEWSSTSNNDWAQTNGIFYVYSSLNSVETYKYNQFPINVEIINNEETLPTEFIFKDNDKKIGCWDSPQFDELIVKFKIYQFYHTASKAQATVTVKPYAADSSIDYKVTLNPLPYQYTPTCDVQFTLNWSKQ